MRWEFLDGPPILVPASAKYPLTGSSGLRKSLHTVDDFVIGARASEINTLERRSKSEEMRVSVREPGVDGCAMEIHHRRRRTGKGSRFRIGPDEKNAAVAGGQRRSEGPSVVDGVDVTIGEYDVGRPLR